MQPTADVLLVAAQTTRLKKYLCVCVCAVGSSLEWIPLQSCVPVLDRFHFSPLRPDLAVQRAAVHAACSSSSASSDQGRESAQAS